jgi:hypothetical protein
MTTRVSPRDRRALVQGAIVVGAAVLLLRGVPGARDLYARERSRAELATSRLALAREAIRRASDSSDSLRLLVTEWSAARVHAFTAPTVNVFSAQVASHITRVARAANVSVTSLQVRPDTVALDGFRNADGRLSARGDIRGLAALVASLELGSKQFRIVSLTVNQSDPIGRPDTPEQLSLELVFRTVALEGEQPGMPAPRRAAALDTIQGKRVTTIVAGNPFRTNRSPAPVPFTLDVGAAKSPAVAAPAAARAVLTLRGIVGPPWSALIEGMPGTAAATVVKAGDRFGDLRVEAIRHDTVIVRGADTTWRLVVARAWR